MSNNSLKEHLYQVRVFDASDNLIGIYDDLPMLSYRKQVNHVSLAVLTVPVNHPLIAQLADDLLIEIFISYKKVPAIVSEFGQQWTSDFLGLYRDKQTTTDADGNIYYLLYVPSVLEVLARYIIAYPAGVNDRTSWVGQQLAYIADNIVVFNCTASATTGNGRLRNATVIRSLSSVGAIGGTPVVNYTAHQRNVLEVLQELAPVCGFDIDVHRGAGVGTLTFEQYLGQLGADKSASIFFDLALDNLAGANYNADRLREKTIAIVGGDGAGSSRVYVIRTGDNYSASNDYEVFVDAATVQTTAELNLLGDTKLGELKAIAKLSADVVSSLGYVYRRDYSYGDLVTVTIGDVSAVRKIDVVEVRFSQDQQVDIRLEFIAP